MGHGSGQSFESAHTGSGRHTGTARTMRDVVDDVVENGDDLEDPEFRRALRSQYRDLESVVKGTPVNLSRLIFRLCTGCWHL